MSGPSEEVEAGGSEEVYKTSSQCLLLYDDGAEEPYVKQVEFVRDERGAGSIDDAAAEVLGIKGERVRCFSVPHMEKKLGYTLHMYIDLQGVEQKRPHNTNATQVFLIANLPEEPPQVSPASIHGPVLLSAENFQTEEYMDLSLEDWKKIRALCRAVQPNAQFVPYEPPAEGEDSIQQDDE